MTLLGYFWDRWPYFAGKLSWDITTTQVNSALLHPSGIASAGVKAGSHRCRVGCDPKWHVIPEVMSWFQVRTSISDLITLLTFMTYDQSTAPSHGHIPPSQHLLLPCSVTISRPLAFSTLLYMLNSQIVLFYVQHSSSGIRFLNHSMSLILISLLHLLTILICQITTMHHQSPYITPFLFNAG